MCTHTNKYVNVKKLKTENKHIANKFTRKYRKRKHISQFESDNFKPSVPLLTQLLRKLRWEGYSGPE